MQGRCAQASMRPSTAAASPLALAQCPALPAACIHLRLRCYARNLRQPGARQLQLVPGSLRLRDNLLQRILLVGSLPAHSQGPEEPSSSHDDSEQRATQGVSALLANAAKLLGAVGFLFIGSLCSPTPQAANAHALDMGAATATSTSSAYTSATNAATMDLRSSTSSSTRYTGLDLADANLSSSAAVLERPSSTAGAKQALTPEYRDLLRRLTDQYLAEHPEHADSPEIVSKMVLARTKGVVLSYDDLMRSQVYNPNHVPNRNSKDEVAEQIDALFGQYDNEDFDLGIKQFMLENKIKAQMEAANGRERGLRKEYEERLAESLYADEEEVNKVKTADMVEDAFTTEQVEEALAVFGEASSVKTAWRTRETLTELAYTQLWTLVDEGHIAKVRFYGPDKRTVMVTTKASAPGGVMQRKVVLPPDPGLLDHLMAHGVSIDVGEMAGSEQQRITQALMIQILRYTLPFMVISGVFWLLHTWILDPQPNAFKRKEFIRYRREMLYVASKLNFRSPAREVVIDTTSPDFIKWDDINGIDEVKKEITEIIDYLKNPALLRSRGVARIGGVMLAGAPGTGKTLLAKAIAAESGVRMFTCSGTDFYDVYSGVGARRIRETFEKLRNFAPAILFVDEFDALGAARGAQASGDESASIINELLVQMDGFEDNRGIVVLGATNRPGAIDSALIRPGRFDRIIYMPLPDAAGRAKILQVHARNKAVSKDINWYEVARAMAGFTGADCMGLMARAARLAARQGREQIEEDDIYAAMENKMMESATALTGVPQSGEGYAVPDPIPEGLRRAIATYEAGKALMAYITPEYEDIARVSVCPYNVVTGYTLFVEDEEKHVGAILTRADLESRMVVSLAGRCAEKLVMGEGELTGMGAPDLFHANMIAREMILELGMGRRMGPMDLMHVVPAQQNSSLLLRGAQNDEADYYYHATDMSTEQARVALAEVVELLEAAEAKAMYGLALNWKPLEALTRELLDRGTLSGAEVKRVLEGAGVVHFPDPYIEGYGWSEDGSLDYPFKPEPPAAITDGSSGDSGGSGGGSSGPQQPSSPSSGGGDTVAEASSTSSAPGSDGGDDPALANAPRPLKGLKSKTWFAGTPKDAVREPDGSFQYGWHWNMPYTIKTDLPDWYKKELERYSY